MERVGRLKLLLWMLVGLAAAVATGALPFRPRGDHPPVRRHALGFVDWL